MVLLLELHNMVLVVAVVPVDRVVMEHPLLVVLVVQVYKY